jgi:tetratricopeptide (TPR) repeat protein
LALGAFGLFVLFALASIGTFGTSAEGWATDILRKAADLHTREGEPLKYGLAVFGALTTLLSGSWGVFKLWHFAEQRMPQRIEEFLLHNERHLIEAGPALLRAIEAPGPQKSWRAPIAFVGPLNDAMRKIGAGNTASAIPDLAHSIHQLSTKRELWTKYEGQTRVQLVNAHLLRGAALAAEAGMKSGEEARRLDIDAEHHFSQAIELDRENAEAYYFRGLQRLRLARRAPASEDLTTATKLSSTEPQSLVRSRANYCLGKLMDEENPNSNLARDRLNEAIDCMPDDLAHSEEGAEIYLYRAKIALGRRKPDTTVAGSCLSQAEDALSGLDSTRARACRTRIAENWRLLKEIAERNSVAPQGG